jgi:Fur family ferric uptake transcriptional regulator
MRIYLIFLKYESIIKNMSESSRKILTKHKVSITNPRILVLEALLEVNNPLTIDELQSKLKGSVAKSTLYRVLNDLKKINILNEFTSPDNSTVVELILEDHSHHHHLFCSDCGEVIDVELSDEFEKILLKEIESIQKKFNFEINDHRVEMFGLCTEECANCK